MDDVEKLRAWMRTQKGNYTAMAKRVGLSTKTLQRIAHDPTWNLTLSTYRTLCAEMRNAPKKGKG